jgi:hypothetical protein
MMNETTALALPVEAPFPVLPNEALVMITYHEGDTFDLPRPVVYAGSSKEDFKRWAVEMMQGGGIPGRPADPTANLDDYSVEPCPRPEAPQPGQRNFNLVLIRPKTNFGC